MASINDVNKEHGDKRLVGNAIGDMGWGAAVNLGMVPNNSRVMALGNNPDVDSASPEDVWAGGGLYPFISTPAPLEIVSTSASDASEGTGARVVRVSGLDSLYAPIEELVTLNGITPVPLTLSYKRINAVLVTTAGVTGVNIGDVSVRDVTGALVRAIVTASYGVTRQSVYTTRAGYTLIVNTVIASINRTGGGAVRYATIANVIRDAATGLTRIPIEVSVSSNTPFKFDERPTLLVPEKTDFLLRVMNVSLDNTDITAAWIGILRKN